MGPPRWWTVTGIDLWPGGRLVGVWSKPFFFLPRPISLQTRFEDYENSQLSAAYFFSKLKEADATLKTYESKAAPKGWLCTWDRYEPDLPLPLSPHSTLTITIVVKSLLVFHCVLSYLLSVFVLRGKIKVFSIEISGSRLNVDTHSDSSSLAFNLIVDLSIGFYEANRFRQYCSGLQEFCPSLFFYVANKLEFLRSKAIRFFWEVWRDVAFLMSVGMNWLIDCKDWLTGLIFFVHDGIENSVGL